MAKQKTCLTINRAFLQTDAHIKLSTPNRLMTIYFKAVFPHNYQRTRIKVKAIKVPKDQVNIS